MFDLGYSELLLVAIVALLVVGPKDLPKLMRTVGQMVGKVRATARHFKAGMDEMVRQAELDEMREKWEAHNAAIMARTSDDDLPAAKDDGPEARQMRGGSADESPARDQVPPQSDEGKSSVDLGEPTGMPPPPAADRSEAVTDGMSGRAQSTLPPTPASPDTTTLDDAEGSKSTAGTRGQ
ncbi:Sec-independent protein translocase protein TatB [Pacificimonas flava]|uniref:Sec-independent protein translocase protein TatB n=1 Tax=Pacificimonas flava TaxID=1234595 RepID=M2T9F1_9SPHN|nr:Sec-independent protein translocase protein TatB [Pacificimonas flava]EMD83189.1 Twin-arginine translocation protein TatB [Pacificimonas flava]MBB5279246.1 sec-independent protein translocase protein TatB [Pacificimonas flava]